MLFFLRLHGQGCQYLLFSCDCPPFTAPKGIKIPSSKILLPMGMIICGHTHIQHITVCECCFWGSVKIDKSTVFVTWVQKTTLLQNALSYSFVHTICLHVAVR